MTLPVRCTNRIRRLNIIAEDILVYRNGDDMAVAVVDHNHNLIYLLQRAREVNLKLNKRRLTALPYTRHLLTSQVLRPDPENIKAIQWMPNLQILNQFRDY